MVILVDDISRVLTAVTIGRQTVKIALQSMWVGMILSLGLMVIDVITVGMKTSREINGD